MKELSKSVLNKLPNGYIDKANAMDLDAIKEEMYKQQRHIANSEKDMAEDPGVLSAKEDLKEKEAVYKDEIAASKACVKYLCYTLTERGL